MVQRGTRTYVSCKPQNLDEKKWIEKNLSF
jgi:hypothetical protein